LGYDNIAYTLRFYSDNHTQYLRDRAQRVLDAGFSLFVSEWGTGTVDTQSDDPIEVEETNKWVQFLEQNKLTHLNWSLHDKREGASALQPGVSATEGWSQNELIESGRFVRSLSKTSPSALVVSLSLIKE